MEGPGKRAALWVQGCAKRCSGCCNPDYLRFIERDMVTVESVFLKIQQAAQDFDLEGVTFLGGEPLLQARGLAVLASRVQKIDLSVMVFTGYTLNELQDMALPGVDELLQLSDIVVDGPYDSTIPDKKRNWVGSSNQRFHYLSDRYDSSIETGGGLERGVEFRIRSDNRIVVNGWPVKIRI